MNRANSGIIQNSYLVNWCYISFVIKEFISQNTVKLESINNGVGLIHCHLVLRRETKSLYLAGLVEA
jgi:hypothetical protein